MPYQPMFHGRTFYNELKNDVNQTKTCAIPDCNEQILFPTITEEVTGTRNINSLPGTVIHYHAPSPAPAKRYVSIPHQSLEILDQQLNLASNGRPTTVDIDVIMQDAAKALLCESHHRSAVDDIAKMWERDFYHEAAQMQTQGITSTVKATPDYTTILKNATVDMINAGGTDGVIIVTTKTQKLRILLAPDVGPGGEGLSVSVANAGEASQVMVAQQGQAGPTLSGVNIATRQPIASAQQQPSSSTPQTSDANAGETSQPMEVDISERQPIAAQPSSMPQNSDANAGGTSQSMQAGHTQSSAPQTRPETREESPLGSRMTEPTQEERDQIEREWQESYAQRKRDDQAEQDRLDQERYEREWADRPQPIGSPLHTPEPEQQEDRNCATQ